MAQRIGKYKVSNKEASIFQHDIDWATPSTLSISGNTSFGTGSGKTCNIASGAGAQKIGFFGATAVVRQAAVADLTDNSGGSASNTIAAISATYDQDEVRDAIASLAAKVDGLSLALRNLGLIA